MADMAHISGLVATKECNSPFEVGECVCGFCVSVCVYVWVGESVCQCKCICVGTCFSERVFERVWRLCKSNSTVVTSLLLLILTRSKFLLMSSFLCFYSVHNSYHSLYTYYIAL